MRYLARVWLPLILIVAGIVALVARDRIRGRYRAGASFRNSL
jgi:hypothetical protein